MSSFPIDSVSSYLPPATTQRLSTSNSQRPSSTYLEPFPPILMAASTTWLAVRKLEASILVTAYIHVPL